MRKDGIELLLSQEDEESEIAFECEEIEIGVLFRLQKYEFANSPYEVLGNLLKSLDNKVKWKPGREIKQKSQHSQTAIFFPIKTGNTYATLSGVKAVAVHLQQEITARKDIYYPQLNSITHDINHKIQTGSDIKIPSNVKSVEPYFQCFMGGHLSE